MPIFYSCLKYVNVSPKFYFIQNESIELLKLDNATCYLALFTRPLI
ncbi:hypothetical protein [Spiroplasma endosymbiont of Danaus chrysippus]|nr:hypothetical protein [Spiroplasma endosymbiont of Danaus chrysippus]